MDLRLGQVLGRAVPAVIIHHHPLVLLKRRAVPPVVVAPVVGGPVRKLADQPVFAGCQAVAKVLVHDVAVDLAARDTRLGPGPDLQDSTAGLGPKKDAQGLLDVFGRDHLAGRGLAIIAALKVNLVSSAHS